MLKLSGELCKSNAVSSGGVMTQVNFFRHYGLKKKTLYELFLAGIQANCVCLGWQEGTNVYFTMFTCRKRTIYSKSSTQMEKIVVLRLK